MEQRDCIHTGGHENARVHHIAITARDPGHRCAWHHGNEPARDNRPEPRAEQGTEAGRGGLEAAEWCDSWYARGRCLEVPQSSIAAANPRSATLEVDDSGEIDLALFAFADGLHEGPLRKQSWGEIHWSTYGDLLVQTDDAKELKQFIAHTKPRAADEIPQEPGFCIERGIIQDPLAASQNEQITMFVGLKGHPDVSIFLYTAAGLKPSDSLLVRNDRIKEEFEQYVTILRRGSRKLAGIDGEEIVERFSELNGTTGHTFQWESVGKQDSVFEPACGCAQQRSSSRWRP